MMQIWREEDAKQDPETGDWIEGEHQWMYFCRCNARQNGKATMIRGQNGESFLYSYEIILPPDVKPIPIGTKVRITDNKQINIFSYAPNGNTSEIGDSDSYYAVKGFYLSGQKNENNKLWL